MAITDLIPWKKKELEREEEGRALAVSQDPFLTFQQRMNRLFDDFFAGSGLEPFGFSQETWEMFHPRLDVTETDKEIKVSVELPGLEEKDVDVRVSQNALTISGQKSREKEEKGHNYLRTERSYGSFKRTIPLHCPVDAGKVDATFRKGVLTVTLPKAVKEQARKRITVKAK